MIGCGTTTFVDPDDYRVSVPGTRINLVLTGSADFQARLTWVGTRRLGLVRCEESVSRVAFIRLAPGPVFVSFPTRHDPPTSWNGIEISPGEIVLHGSGERFHQRTTGASRWGLISVTRKDLGEYGKTLARVELVPPPAARILRPLSEQLAGLLRLFRQTCRLAETKPGITAHREVVRALEHDLLHALVNCLSASGAHHDAGARARHAEIIARFEDVLASHDGAQPPMPELATAVGVPERTLRVCCAEVLGMSPGEYARLLRLNLVRAALRSADPAEVRVAEVARRYGFSELGRFAAAYRTVFGEAPSTTLRDHGAKIRRAAEFA